MSNALRIVSGEGEQGAIEVYTGKRTPLAITRRLDKDRCGGDRWARLEMHCGTDAAGMDIWVAIEPATVDRV